MTNEERRLALAKARRKALEYAELVAEADTGDWGAIDTMKVNTWIQMARMWADVANAMKVGDPTGPDAVIPDLSEIVTTR